MTDRSDHLVSVVIPCYNADRWIGETIESVVAQDDIAFEAILVNDGSEDRSVERATAAGGNLLRVIHQSRAGVSRARNAGTAAARGSFIQYLDADDVLATRTTLRARVDALEQSASDVAYCDWVRWESQADGTFHEGSSVQRVLSARPDVDLFGDAWWPPGALLYRRSVVESILPWREDLPVIQDARFVLDAALAGARFVRVDHVGLRYRVLGDSLSRRNLDAFLEDCYRNAADLHAHWRDEGTFDSRAQARAHSDLHVSGTVVLRKKSLAFQRCSDRASYAGSIVSAGRPASAACVVPDSRLSSCRAGCECLAGSAACRCGQSAEAGTADCRLMSLAPPQSVWDVSRPASPDGEPFSRGQSDDLTALGLLTALYFAAVIALSTTKPVSYNELFTFHISSLPSLTAIFQALSKGIDNNPPLLYFATHGSTAAVGEGNLGVRLPSISAYYLAAFSLFWLARARMPSWIACLAGLLLLTSRTFPYAYEARPYAFMLGFGALAMLLWQRYAATMDRRYWPDWRRV